MTGFGFMGVQTGPLPEDDHDIDRDAPVDFADGFTFNVERPAGRCWNCGGSGVRCCEWGADRPLSTRDARAAGTAGRHGHHEQES